MTVQGKRRPPHRGGNTGLVVVTMATLFSMVLMLVWMHMTQGVRSQLEKLQAENEGAAVGLKERRRLLREHIVRTRSAAEQTFHATIESNRAADLREDRVTGSCADLEAWQSTSFPCPPAPPRSSDKLIVVTEHFGSSTNFLLPHYDELGEWQVSVSQPTLWNVYVNKTNDRALYCAEKWLALTKAFNTLGSIPADLAASIESKTKALDIPKQLGNLDFVKGLYTFVTFDVATMVQGLSESGFHDTTAFEELKVGAHSEMPDKRLRYKFLEGMRWILAHLVHKDIQEWTVEDLKDLHKAICQDEPEVDEPGAFRRPSVHVGFALDIPPPLGFEVNYLMGLYVAWLHRADQEKCLPPLLLAFEAFTLLHRIQPFMNCNSRMAKLVMNALLLKGGLPPLHMFLYTSKDGLRNLENRCYNGDRTAMYTFYAEKISRVADVFATGAIRHLGSLRG